MLLANYSNNNFIFNGVSINEHLYNAENEWKTKKEK